MKNFFPNACLKNLLWLIPCFSWGASFRCDLYFFSDPTKIVRSYEPLTPKMREYPLSVRVIQAASAGPELPETELKKIGHLRIESHLSWVIPSFSQKIFLSLMKEHAVFQFDDIGSTDDPLFSEPFDDYTRTEGPSLKKMTMNRQNIGVMEICSHKNHKIQCALTIHDPPYHIHIHEALPLQQWIVIDTPSRVAILYLSPL